MTYQQWLAIAIADLVDSQSPRRDAEILLASTTGKSRAYILAFAETVLTEEQLNQLTLLLKRRQKGEPIAYILGQKEFWSLPLTVSPVTLIPRPETECLVEHALERLPSEPCSVLDLGCGTGAIALALASERPDCQIIGVDSKKAAVELAQYNAAQLNLAHCQFLLSDWFQQLAGQRFHLIVSNPPYIDSQDPHLKMGDVRYEPSSALVAGEHGMADIIHIVSQSQQYLFPQGWLLIEHGWQQGKAVRDCFIKYKFQSVVTYRDYAGQERVTVGQFNKKF